MQQLEEFILYCISATIGIAGAGFSIVFSLATGIIKKLLKTTKHKKNMIKFLCWLKLSLIALKLQYLKH